MRDLDKELFYTLENIQVDCSELTEEQVKEMCKVYENNGYKKWIDPEAFIIIDNFTYLRIDSENEFYITGGLDTKTTITYEKFMALFTPKYEVTMIAEKPKSEMKTFKVIEYSTGDFMDLGKEAGIIKAIDEDKAWELYKETHRLRDREKGFYSFVEIKDINQALTPVVDKLKEFNDLVESLNEELTEEAYKETEYEVKYIAEKPKQYQAHYNNENGSLYKIATDLGLNHWEFDILKRLVRCRKKGQFAQDIQKIKDTADIYLNEFKD